MDDGNSSSENLGKKVMDNRKRPPEALLFESGVVTGTKPRLDTETRLLQRTILVFL